VSEIAYPEVVTMLVKTVPEFAATLDEHVKTFDELLPHVLFGDLTRFVTEAHNAGEDELVERCLRFLGDALTHGDPKVTNLVQVSFIENMQPWDSGSSDFIGTWPAALRSAAADQGWVSPSS